jgi:hypothetical protein
VEDLKMATGAEIAAALAIKAAEEFVKKVAENAADEFTDWLFGKDDDLDDLDVINEKLDALQKQVAIVDAKLTKVIGITATTLLLVKNFPEVLLRGLVEAERNKAHRDLASAITVFNAIDDWDREVGLDALTERFQDWNALIDLEDRVEELVRLPVYAEFLRVVSLGSLTNVLIEGVSLKIDALKDLLEDVVQNQLAPKFKEAESFISAGYLVNGGLLLSEPWVRGELAAKRGRLESYDTCTHAGYHDYDDCIRDRYIPDVKWNRSIIATSQRLPTLRDEISNAYAELITLQVPLITLTRYKEYLLRNSGSETKGPFAQPRVKNASASKGKNLLG